MNVPPPEFPDGNRDEGDDAGRRVLACHKAEGDVVSRNDPEGRPSVFDRLPALRGGRWVSIGRLDIDSSGLLLFTNDAEFANRLMHPSTGIEREYAVRVQGEVTPAVREALLQGVMLEDGLSRFNRVDDAGVQSGNHWYRCSLTGSKFREVRRLWESQGIAVTRLMRIRFGNYAMPSSLRQGSWVELSADEVARLEQLCRLPPRKHTGLYGRARRMADKQDRGWQGDGGGERPRKGGYLRGRR